MNKTDSYFNEDDFRQTEHGALEELTVTITLCEYRNLVREQAQNEITISRQADEIKELRLKLADMGKALGASEMVAWIKKICNRIEKCEKQNEEVIENCGKQTEEGEDREYELEE